MPDGNNGSQNECLNGHAANSNGNCFDSGCVYRNDNRHTGQN